MKVSMRSELCRSRKIESIHQGNSKLHYQTSHEMGDIEWRRSRTIVCHDSELEVKAQEN